MNFYYYCTVKLLIVSLFILFKFNQCEIPPETGFIKLQKKLFKLRFNLLFIKVFILH